MCFYCFTGVFLGIVSFVLISAEEESLGWGPVLASLQVPELTVEDFLSESQSGGSFLTLYAFIQQRLNTEYTAANERRTLALINTWTNQVFPRFDPPIIYLPLSTFKSSTCILAIEL